MHRKLMGAAVVLLGLAATALAGGHGSYGGEVYCDFGQHGYYAHPQYGRPIALVVPPTARRQTAYSWGVPSMRVGPIMPQFSPAFPGYGYDPATGGYYPMPMWPSDTSQFGVYYGRGPW